MGQASMIAVRFRVWWRSRLGVQPVVYQRVLGWLH